MRSESHNFPGSFTILPFCRNFGKIALVINILIIFHNSSQAGNKAKKLFAKGSTTEKLAGNFKFTEGPACDSQGNIFFSDQPNNRIMKWSTNNKLSLFGENFGRANGMHFDHKGNLITCSDEKNQVWSITPDGKSTVLVSDFEGRRLNGPNDLWVAPNGGLYITDPYYKRSWWDHDKPQQDAENVYYLAPGSSKLVKVADDLQKPNGIVGTPDGKYLYVADIKGNKTWLYRINKDGSLGGKKLFAEQGSDGMTIDNLGNIYMTGSGVTVYNSKGELLAKIPTKESWTTNVCFGGKGRHLLFITAVKSVYGIKMKVRGVN